MRRPRRRRTCRIYQVQTMRNSDKRISDENESAGTLTPFVCRWLPSPDSIESYDCRGTPGTRTLSGKSVHPDSGKPTPTHDAVILTSVIKQYLSRTSPSSLGRPCCPRLREMTPPITVATVAIFLLGLGALFLVRRLGSDNHVLPVTTEWLSEIGRASCR